MSCARVWGQVAILNRVFKESLLDKTMVEQSPDRGEGLTRKISGESSRAESESPRGEQEGEAVGNKVRGNGHQVRPR